MPKASSGEPEGDLVRRISAHTCCCTASTLFNAIAKFNTIARPAALEGPPFGGLGTAFDRGERPLVQLHSLLNWEVAERQQLVESVDSLGQRLAELRTISQLERGHRPAVVRRSSAFPTSVGAFAAPGCSDFGGALRTLAIL